MCLPISQVFLQDTRNEFTDNIFLGVEVTNSVGKFIHSILYTIISYSLGQLERILTAWL